MTEDEALSKWCPFVRVFDNSDDEQAQRNVAGWNRFPAGAGKLDTTAYRAGCEMVMVNCIGSACMAWRWLDPEVDTTQTLEDAPAPGPEWSKVATNQVPYTKFTQKWTRPKSDRNGFCGLAGAPT